MNSTTNGEKQVLLSPAAAAATPHAQHLRKKKATEMVASSKSFLLSSSHESTPAYTSDNRLRRCLGPKYKLNGHDVICGRGKRALDNDGNKIFRAIVTSFLNNYLACKKRVDKQECIAEIIDVVRSSGGHFLKEDKAAKQWYDMGDKAAASKIGHCLRDRKSEHCCLLVEKSVKVKQSFRKARMTAKKKDDDEREQEVLDFDGMVFHPIDKKVLDSLDFSL